MRRAAVVLSLLAAAWAVWTPRAAADGEPPQPSGVGFDPQLGAAVPADLSFVDESGAPVRLGDYLGSTPVVLTLNYYACQNFCGVAMEGLAQGLDGVALEPGRDYHIVTVSIDPRETSQAAAGRKDLLARHYPRVANGPAWHFLTGQNDAIERLAEAVGFRYAFDPQSDEFMHPTGAIVLTAGGRISSYLYGVSFAPRDLRLALVGAGQGRVGSVLDRLALLCYHYDPATGRYTPAVLRAVRWTGGLMAAGLLGGLAWLWREEWRRHGQPPAKAASREDGLGGRADAA